MAKEATRVRRDGLQGLAQVDPLRGAGRRRGRGAQGRRARHAHARSRGFGPGLRPRIGASRPAVGGLHGDLDPRRDADPAQWLPAAQAPPRLTEIRTGHRPVKTLEKAGQGACLYPLRGIAVVIQKNWQELIKPNKLEVAQGDDPKRVATLVAEPLERGFGMTLGNALRRVLLSSLQGSAITTVHIDGVLHEFSSIPGVREDVTNMVLNIKEIALRLHSDGVKRMVLKKEGPGPVKASDIEASSEV